MDNNLSFLCQDLLEQAIAGIKNNRPIFIYGAFGAGKSPFVNNLVSELSSGNPDVFIVRIDFNDFPSESFETMDSLFWEIVKLTIAQTEQDLEAVRKTWEENSIYLTTQVNVIEILGDTIKKLNKTLILVVENTHRITKQPYVAFFYDNLRGFKENLFPAFNIIVSLISNHDEIINELSEKSLFFGISVSIYLTALDERQIALLLESYGFENSEDIVRRIISLVGGNLYLISLMLDRAAEMGRDVRQVLTNPEDNHILDPRLNKLHSLILSVDDAPRILAEFREKDTISVHPNGRDKSIYDELAKIGVLNRENYETEILYSVQGEQLKKLVRNIAMA